MTDSGAGWIRHQVVAIDRDLYVLLIRALDSHDPADVQEAQERLMRAAPMEWDEGLDEAEADRG